MMNSKQTIARFYDLSGSDRDPFSKWNTLSSSNIGEINANHAVRRKAYGSRRYLLLIDGEDRVFKLDQRGNASIVRGVSFWYRAPGAAPDVPHVHMTHTLIDGRYHRGGHDDKNANYFMIHDILVLNGQNYQVYPYAQRMSLINTYLIEPRRQKLGADIVKEQLRIYAEPSWDLCDAVTLLQPDGTRELNFLVSGLLFQPKMAYRSLYKYDWTVNSSLTPKALFDYIDSVCNPSGGSLSNNDQLDGQRDTKRRRRDSNGVFKDHECMICFGDLRDGRCYGTGVCYHPFVCLKCMATKRLTEKPDSDDTDKSLRCYSCQNVMPCVLYSREKPDRQALLARLQQAGPGQAELFEDNTVLFKYNVLKGFRCKHKSCEGSNVDFGSLEQLKYHMEFEHGEEECPYYNKDGFVGDYICWADKSTPGRFLDHLLQNHKMCYYCAYTDARHNQWFTDDNDYLDHSAFHTADNLYLDGDWLAWREAFITLQETQPYADRRNYNYDVFKFLPVDKEADDLAACITNRDFDPYRQVPHDVLLNNVLDDVDRADGY